MQQERSRSGRETGVAWIAVVLGGLLVGCPTPTPPPSRTGSGATCDPGSTLTYDNFGRAFFGVQCVRCHGATVVGDARMGAPEGLDFDTLDGIRENADRIDRVAAGGPLRTNMVMPPAAPFPTHDQRIDLGVWLACGAP